MKLSKRTGQPHFRKAATWKWIVILLLVVAMPLFFSYYRTMRLQQVLGPNTPSPSSVQHQ